MGNAAEVVFVLVAYIYPTSSMFTVGNVALTVLSVLIKETGRWKHGGRVPFRDTGFLTSNLKLSGQTPIHTISH